MRLIDLLHRIKSSRITSAELTGELEMHLDEVERGKRKPSTFMSEIIDYTKELVEATRGFDYDEIYPDIDPLGVCPCGKKRPVYERSWFYRCEENPNEEEDCPFRIWKDKNGRYIDRATVTTLLEKGETGELDGFRDRQGRSYKGRLKIENMQIVLVPIAGSEQAVTGDELVFEVNPEPLGIDPTNPEAQVVETPTHFISAERKRQIEAGEPKPKGFVLPRVVCKREIKREEAIEYMKNGETPFINDFISRFGRPFQAKLKMKEDGRHTFEFMPREGGGGRRGGGKKKTSKKDAQTAEVGQEGEEKPAVKKKASKKKASAKKTTKKTPRKKKATTE